MSKPYTWHFASDEINYKHFAFNLDCIMAYKSKNCAPVHEEHWADAVITQIETRFTDKQIRHIVDELTDVLKRRSESCC